MQNNYKILQVANYYKKDNNTKIMTLKISLLQFVSYGIHTPCHSLFRLQFKLMAYKGKKDRKIS